MSDVELKGGISLQTRGGGHPVDCLPALMLKVDKAASLRKVGTLESTFVQPLH